MGKSLGYVWAIQWSSPYTQPPDGMPRELLRVETPPGSTTAVKPPEILALSEKLGYGTGWAVCVGAIEKPIVRKSPEQLAVIRRQHLERRMRKRHPLFAEEFIAEAIVAKPDYYAGMDLVVR